MSEEMMDQVENSGDISIHLASPDLIRFWSWGEVTKPETINYRSFKPGGSNEVAPEAVRIFVGDDGARP